jgi:hypothetical protein
VNKRFLQRWEKKFKVRFGEECAAGEAGAGRKEDNSDWKRNRTEIGWGRRDRMGRKDLMGRNDWIAEERADCGGEFGSGENNRIGGMICIQTEQKDGCHFYPIFAV